MWSRLIVMIWVETNIDIKKRNNYIEKYQLWLINIDNKSFK